MVFNGEIVDSSSVVSESLKSSGSLSASSIDFFPFSVPLVLDSAEADIVVELVISPMSLPRILDELSTKTHHEKKGNLKEILLKNQRSLYPLILDLLLRF